MELVDDFHASPDYALMILESMSLLSSSPSGNGIIHSHENPQIKYFRASSGGGEGGYVDKCEAVPEYKNVKAGNPMEDACLTVSYQNTPFPPVQEVAALAVP